jgi:phage shock protein PspC (stress-responsive transcriptional regulator)
MIQWGMVGHFVGDPLTLCYALKVAALVLGLFAVAWVVVWLIIPAESGRKDG